MKRLLVVGEQCQEQYGNAVWTDVDPFNWFINARCLGIFNGSSQAAKYGGLLESIIPKPWDGINLLPQGFLWTKDVAERFASELQGRLWDAWQPTTELNWGRAEWQRQTWKYSGIVLLGDKVAKAWGFDLLYYEADGGVILLPHPRDGISVSRTFSFWYEGLADS